MSIYIKGLNIPKEGFIKLEIHSDGTVWEEGGDWERYENAAFEVDSSHGDLIDRDIVRDECYKTMGELMQSTTINLSAEALSLLCGFTIINNVPTIIEAEERRIDEMYNEYR